jgi:hypothetical protein
MASRRPYKGEGVVLSPIFWLAVIVGAVLFGLYLRRLENDATIVAVDSGWVYFLSPHGGALQDPPSPIKIGSTYRDPYEDRLPEIETMSPVPLEVIYAFRCDNYKQVETALHRYFKPFHQHGEWFDRDPVLAWIDHYSH